MSGFETYNIILRSNLKRLRKKRRLTQQMMADSLGMTKDNYYRIESGKQSIKVELLPIIAECLNTNIDALYTLENTNVMLDDNEKLLVQYARELAKPVAIKFSTLAREIKLRGLAEQDLDLLVGLVRQFKE